MKIMMVLVSILVAGSTAFAGQGAKKTTAATKKRDVAQASYCQEQLVGAAAGHAMVSEIKKSAALAGSPGRLLDQEFSFKFKVFDIFDGGRITESGRGQVYKIVELFVPNQGRMKYKVRLGDANCYIHGVEDWTDEQ